jgi:N6-adenosine-specific RNA methylase IME4
MKGSMTKGEQRAVPFDEYATMSLPDIAALPVRDLAADGCHLYLWTTQAFLRDAYTVLDAWGFKQGALLVWSKPPKGVCGTWVCSAEFCIFARRGTLKHLRRHIGTVFEWKRGRHSAKPEAFQDMVETVSPGPYLELFARRERPGWTVWGNEVPCKANPKAHDLRSNIVEPVVGSLNL